jgi:hypothetical protein
MTQPQEDTTDQIAGQFGFKTLVYEYSQKGELIIVPVEDERIMNSQVI